MKMNHDKERDRRTIKELKAQLNSTNGTPQSPVKSSVLTASKNKEKRQEEHRYTSEVPSEYLVTKRLLGKINSPDKLTNGVTPKAKYWLISMVNDTVWGLGCTVYCLSATKREEKATDN